MSKFRLVFDVSAEDDPTTEKIRYAWYESKKEALAQAEHEMATPAAVKRHQAHYNAPDLVMHPTGVTILRIEDASGKTVWQPD